MTCWPQRSRRNPAGSPPSRPCRPPTPPPRPRNWNAPSADSDSSAPCSSPRTGDLYLDHNTFRPVFEAAAGLGVPLYIHPEIAPHPVRDVYFSGFSDDINVILATGGWGWHTDAGIAALRLILTG